MQVEIPCERCHVQLRVPCEAVGHRARCPGCGHEFVVPEQVQSLMEETVSEWIEHDVEEVLEGHHREIEEQLRQTVSRRPVEKPSKAVAATREPPPPTRFIPLRSDPRQALPSGVALPNPDGTPHRGLPRVSPVRVDASRRTRPERHDAGEEHRYPSGLHVEERVPHLVVRSVGAAGVRFAFDSAWLAHEGFRASMPMRCAFSGTTAREKLIARPMFFGDRAGAACPPIDTVHAAHQNRQLVEHGPREVMRSMGLIEGMPRPFAYAMPYYVSTRFGHMQLHCQTRDRSSGGITCEVLIPDPLTALDWLARVNGVCGKEYELLEQDAQVLHGEAWADLAEDVRQRIAVWCKLGPRELLRRYFPDADFGKRDQGLAGVALTDQRLVFCKYHHRGSVRLDTDDAEILARADGAFLALTLRVGHDLHRMIKLHRHDLEALQETLGQHGKITLRMG